MLQPATSLTDSFTDLALFLSHFLVCLDSSAHDRLSEGHVVTETLPNSLDSRQENYTLLTFQKLKTGQEFKKWADELTSISEHL